MNTSRKEGKASRGERVEPEFDFVLDFLYYDSRRIGLFNSQFFPDGVLQQVEKTDSRTKTTSDSSGRTIAIGPRALSRKGNRENETQETGSDSSKLTYDPLWANALTFLDSLEERNLIRRDLRRARIGQLLLVSGRLTILDMGLLKPIWQVPEAKQNALQSAIVENPESQRSELERNIDILRNYISGDPVWGTVACSRSRERAPRLIDADNARVAECSSGREPTSFIPG